MRPMPQNPDGDGPAPEHDPRPWHQRHRMRALLVIIAVWAAFCATIFTAVAAYFITQTRNSEPFALALERVRADAELRQILGTPIEPGWLTLGSVDNDRGYAEFTMRVKGPRAKAGLRVIAEKAELNGEPWELVFLDAGVRDEYGGRVVTLINDKPPTGPTMPEPTEAARERYGK